jgi:hypothetical protein
VELRKNFLGIPVVGDIEEADKRPNQKPVEELSPYLEAVFADDSIEAIRWEQYTPYFNDGDPCVFGICEPRFALKDEAPNADESDYGDEFFSLYDNVFYMNEHPATEQVKALAGAIYLGEFEDVLLEAFGDHAQVTVYRDRIEVETFEHD